MTNPAAPVEASPGVGLSVTGLSVTYGRHVVVRDVTFDVAPGSWLGVIGPNGAGKSSVLRAVAGLVEATGEITFHGSVNPKRAQVVAYLPQTPELPAAMTVAEYVLLGRSAHLGWFESESRKDRSVVAASLARLELTGFAERNLTELSGGEAQRVALARALAQDAPILVLDEPTSALDLGHQVSVLELIAELRVERNLTVVSAMHDLTAAGRFADSLLLLDVGRRAAWDTPEAVLVSDLLSPVFGTHVMTLEAPDGSRVVVPGRETGPDSVA